LIQVNGGTRVDVSIKLLSSIPLFSGLEEKELAVLETHAQQRSFAKNSVLMTEGESPDSLYLIEEGKVKVYLNDHTGREVILAYEEAGGYLGEIALLDDAPRSASVMTLTPTQVLIISKSDFRSCLASNPDVALSIIRVLTQRVRKLTEDVRSLALRSVYQRLVEKFMELAVETDGEMVVTERLTQQDIASLIGASREMVSRVMRDLSAGGYIDTSGRYIRILRKLPHGW